MRQIINILIGQIDNMIWNIENNNVSKSEILQGLRNLKSRIGEF